MRIEGQPIPQLMSTNCLQSRLAGQEAKIPKRASVSHDFPTQAVNVNGVYSPAGTYFTDGARLLCPACFARFLDQVLLVESLVILCRDREWFVCKLTSYTLESRYISRNWSIQIIATTTSWELYRPQMSAHIKRLAVARFYRGLTESVCSIRISNYEPAFVAPR